MRAAVSALVLLAAIAAADVAFAQTRGAAPGRERQQLGFPSGPQTPRIELRDGRPAPVIETQKRKPPKRKRTTKR
jgi:hypothetical protein